MGVRSAAVDPVAAQLVARGSTHVRDIHGSVAVAWGAAMAIFRAAGPHDPIGADMPPLEAVGEFTVPPPGAPGRDYQALHIDFGIPVGPRRPVDVARFTALYVDIDRPRTTARTRIVPLRPLLAQRAWADRPSLIDRLRRYGSPQSGEHGYVEGILGRLVEAADDSPSLPSTTTPGFLCGLGIQLAASGGGPFRTARPRTQRRRRARRAASGRTSAARQPGDCARAPRPPSPARAAPTLRWLGAWVSNRAGSVRRD